MKLKTRKQLRDILIFDEGLRLKAYKCTAGAWTIGCGRNLSAKGITAEELAHYRNVGITQEQAMRWLDQDIESAEFDCFAIFGEKLWDQWSETRKMGWINFLFQLGMKNALGFKNTLAAAMKEDWKTVETNMRKSRWYSQTPKRAERVIGLICKEEILYP